VVVAFVERDDTVLMEHRADCDQWCLIGGRIEPDQSVEAALRQEVHEETGLTVRDFALFGVFSDPSMIAEYTHGTDQGTEVVIARVISLAFRVQVDDFGPLQVSEESTELRFFSHAELRTLDIIPTVRHIVDRYLADRTALIVE
jgi:8-oxo-dGTP pyrophosphatase MutT (NUDIX family)